MITNVTQLLKTVITSAIARDRRKFTEAYPRPIAVPIEDLSYLIHHTPSSTNVGNLIVDAVLLSAD